VEIEITHERINSFCHFSLDAVLIVQILINFTHRPYSDLMQILFFLNCVL